VTETWRQIPSIPTHEVSDRGRVRRLVQSRNWVAGKILSASLCRKGYLRVTINDRGYQVHALVCEAFNGPKKPGQLCRHLNDVKDDIRPDNLAWGSYLDNSADQRRNGKEARHRRSFDRDEAHRLRALGLTTHEIGYFLGVSNVAISGGFECDPDRAAGIRFRQRAYFKSLI
jgi:hypothetical protein